MKKQISTIFVLLVLILSATTVFAESYRYAEGTGTVTTFGNGFTKASGKLDVEIDTWGSRGKIVVKNADNIVIEKRPGTWIKKYTSGNVTKIFINGKVRISGKNTKVEFVVSKGVGIMTTSGTGWIKSKGMSWGTPRFERRAY